MTRYVETAVGEVVAHGCGAEHSACECVLARLSALEEVAAAARAVAGADADLLRHLGRHAEARLAEALARLEEVSRG